MNEINTEALAEKVMHWCDQLAAISSHPENISRFYLTPEHKRCNELVAQWMQDAGMETWVDAAGNLCGRYDGKNPCAKTLILASHLDSIPNAGAYDGILGVLVAIAVVEQFYQNDITLPYAIDIIGFGDEEGTRFGSTLLGSRAVAGTWNPEWWELKDRNGISLKQAFIDFGLDPDNIQSAARNPDDLLAYLEVHIEQGPVLENENLALGIVTAIAGARRFSIDIEGYAGHAGTVPMPMRKDALVGAALGVVLVENIAKEFDVVATVGKIECGPGAVNVIPGHATFTIDIRSGDDQLRDQAFAKIQHELDMICLNRNLVARWSEIHNAPAVVCADWIQALQASVLRDMNLHPYTLMSGAGHDAMAMADICDVAMYFVRCKGGVSHHPDESVTVDDVALAIDALSNTLQKLAQ
ncbi:allantoate amidohydrolase [Cellvibrio mixtus]|uniref:Allantoate amidohydrolase n=1 Tax=Cellvibrio mixtus TaxID=39650 RepID=A0A266Q1G2_9GAMM|nr:allantoate amidohydrolase [Cellvibrio mixtus]OZY83690.1 allantoate amidohydrolase [Cellvibrio mixtus]